MVKRQARSLTQRIGGNRAIVLGIMILMLVLFTVDMYVLPALGVSSRRGDLVQFTVNGRGVTWNVEKFQSALGQWQRYQYGRAKGLGAGRGTSREDFLEELMLEELARDAGLSVTDETLASFLREQPQFHGSGGEFDPKVFADALREDYAGMSAHAFEEEARREVLLGHFLRLYVNARNLIGDEECWKRWKRDHPRVAVAYAWQPVAPIREGLKPADVKDDEVETYWKDAAVQGRHKIPPKRTFEAAWVRIDDVSNAAFDAAREAWKGEADLALKEGEAREFWWASQKYDFGLEDRDEDLLESLRKENEEAGKKEGGEPKPEPPKEGAAPAGGKKEEAAAPAPAPAPVPADEGPPSELDTEVQFQRYWRRRVEKEVWLRKLLDRVRKEATEGKVPLAEAAAKWSRPGLEVKVHRQETPLDQYEVERLEGPGGGPLRYVLNDYGKPEQVGTVHPETLQRTAFTSRTDQRGWVVVRVTGIQPETLPPLADVREAVVSELLDDRAKEQAKARLAGLRKAAEEGKLSLEEAAKKEGFECATTEPFNEFTWQPPLPKPEPGKEAPPAADGWRDPARRTSAIRGKYYPMRETPVGSFTDVFDDASSSGAFYMAQVKSRAEPAFEEMTQANLSQVRRVVARERIGDLRSELSYGRLKDRLGLLIDGKPAPEAEPSLRGRR